MKSRINNCSLGQIIPIVIGTLFEVGGQYWRNM